jgi:hypothetical protein
VGVDDVLVPKVTGFGSGGLKTVTCTRAAVARSSGLPAVALVGVIEATDGVSTQSPHERPPKPIAMKMMERQF